MIALAGAISLFMRFVPKADILRCSICGYK